MKLKKLAAISIGTLLLVLGFSTAIALAVDEQPTTTSADQQTEKVLNEGDRQKLQQRLAERKAQAKLRLTTAQKNRLKTRCKNAQGVMAPVKARVQGIETGRSKVYNGIVDKLTDLSAKIQDRGLDTAELDVVITTLKEKVTTFNNDLVVYKQAVTDLIDMDCAADPEAFKASIEIARTALGKVNQDAQDIRTYVKDSIKPALVNIRGQLSASDTAEGNE